MNRSRIATAGLVVVAALFAIGATAVGPAIALVPSLSHAEELAALAAGRSAASKHLGLAVETYVAYAAPDTLAAERSGKAIDAIVVGTPFERVLYASYEAAFQNAAPTPTALDDAASADCIDMIVVAHSRDTQDQSFLRRFRNPALHVGGRTLHPVKTTVRGPGEDFFTTTQGRELLWLGNDAFRFDLRGLEAAGIDVRNAQARFSIADPYGHTYDVKLDMATYR